MDERRIILTNLNPSVYTRRYVSSFLTELIINSLLYEKVLIREGDLICNRAITSHLRDRSNFDIFKELLAVGAVRVLRLDPRSLPSGLAIDRDRHPLSARAEDQMRHRSYKGRPWKPERWEWKIYEQLDGVLTSSPAFELQKRLPKKNDFAAALKEILINREKYDLRRRYPFHDIDDEMANRFIDFCSEPEDWVRYLHDAKIPLVGTTKGFYRTAAYQCADSFVHGNGMKRLVESTFAACDCARENADGRYGRSALAELPFVYNSEDEQRLATETVIKMEVVPVGSPMIIGVSPGIGEVVAAARDHQAFRDMQEAHQSLLTADDPERVFRKGWESLSSVVSDIWCRKMVRKQPVDYSIGNIAAKIYLTSRFLGYVVFHGAHDVDWPIVIDDVVTKRIEHWVPALSQSVRSLVRLPRIRREMANAATLRCTRVNLYSDSAKPI